MLMMDRYESSKMFARVTFMSTLFGTLSCKNTQIASHYYSVQKASTTVSKMLTKMKMLQVYQIPFKTDLKIKIKHNFGTVTLDKMMVQYLLTVIRLRTQSTNSNRNANRFPELGAEEIILPLVVTRVLHRLHTRDIRNNQTQLIL